MSNKEFNEKYKKYLEKNHYGLAINNEKFINWLDNKFQEFIKNSDFSYSQIKLKFNMGIFYCNGLSNQEIKEVENKITELCKN